MKLLYYIIGIFVSLSFSEVRAEHRYRLHLDGKPESGQVAFSDRAQERRRRLGIADDSLDLEVSPLYLSRIRSEGLKVVTSSHWLNTVVVMAEDGTRVSEAFWSKLPFITRIDTITTTQRATSPQRSKLQDPAALALCSASSADESPSCAAPLTQVNALQPLYEAGYRGKGMLIAVLDAGFNRVDTWQWMNANVIGVRDMYEASTGMSKVYTGDFHGSACLSIMAAPQDHGIFGTAQEADYFLIRTETNDSETSLEEDMWVAGAELADSLGADVISSSLGYTEFDSDLASHTWEEFTQGIAQISRGAQVACDKGMLVCNAAGNYGSSDWRYVFFPADVEDVLTIGGVTSQGKVCSFSSRGFTTPYVKPDISARGSNCYVVSNTDSGQATTGNGTSYATPLIAGLCASLWGAFPTLGPAQIRKAIRESASQYVAPDSVIGYGIPDFGIAYEKAKEMAGPQLVETIKAESPKALGIDLFGRRLSPSRRRDIVLKKGNIVLFGLFGEEGN